MTTKYYLLLIVQFLLAHSIIGQFSEEKIISTQVNLPASVYATDIDGDGDMDVLSASLDDDKIAWYANDGIGNFSGQKIISTQVNTAHSVYATDIDGDGDMDVLSAAFVDDNNIAWYANDGIGNFSGQKNISTRATGAISVYATDIDGDGDMDVLSTAAAPVSTDDIAWYANDGIGNFSGQNIISTQADYVTSVYATDVDDDGDMDVLFAAANAAKIAWYANDGIGNFSGQNIISTQAEGARSVYATDVDGDGDMDVLSASEEDNKIAWYANDGAGNFSGQNIISTQAEGARSVYATDVDGDGDMDVLSTSLNDAKIAWYANDGVGNFSGQNIISTQANGVLSVYATDVDGDGDMDVLSASANDDKIAWYENLTQTTSIDDLTLYQEIIISPNPFADFLTIERVPFSNEVAILTIYDIAGRQLKIVILQDAATQQISTASFAKGLYFYEMTNVEGQMIGNGKLVRQ